MLVTDFNVKNSRIGLVFSVHATAGEADASHTVAGALTPTVVSDSAAVAASAAGRFDGQQTSNS
jgi:hypothetical protein